MISNIESKELTKEINDNLELWLKLSGFTKEKLKLARTVDSFKIEEEDVGDKKVLNLCAKINNQPFHIGIPIIQGPISLEEFYYDSFLLCLAIARILDDENLEHPINGGYADRFFKRCVERFFEKKIH